MAKHAGVARHAWNWGLATCQEIYDSGFRERQQLARLKFIYVTLT